MEVKNQISWHAQSKKDVFEAFSSSKKGLLVKEAERRLRENGVNEIPKQPPRAVFSIFIQQFMSPFMLILIFAAIVSLFLKEFFDVIVISLAVTLNVVLGFFQEYKADRSLHALQAYLPQTVNVKREGKIHEISASQIVVGDILLLAAGEKITADGRVIDAQTFSVDESALTGESSAVKKHSEAVASELAIADQKNMVFAGTVVVGGHAQILVTAIGLHTEIGKISQLVSEIEDEDTPLQAQLGRFASILGLAVLALAGIIFIGGSLAGFNIAEMFYLSVAIAVSSVPEGMAVSLTVILAIGMQRILKKKALVRKLVSAETLGSVSVICMDKTGTLTTGQMEVSEIRVGNDIVPIGSNDQKLYEIGRAILTTNASILEIDDKTHKEVLKGSPTEIALRRYTERLEPNLECDKYTLISELPFDSIKKYSASSFTFKKHRILYAVGAPEMLLAKADVSDKERQQLLKTFEEMTASGLRVLLVAKAEEMPEHKELTDSLVNDLKVIGFVGLKDPIRKETNATIAKAKKAGLRVVMITGDHPQTARAIALEAGIEAGAQAILTGAELDEMNDEDLKKRVDQFYIYARVAPKHKLRIIRAWQSRGKSVAMTGDGVNDAPALKASDIGIALGSGTAVAKETADMILLDNNVKTIIDAIYEGRTIFDNIRKMMVYFLSDSFSEIILVVGALALSLPLPILPAQILWINLIADGLPSVALTFEPGEDGIMDEPPRPKSEPILNSEMKILIFLVGMLTDFLLFGIYFYLLHHSTDIEEIRTFIFLTLGLDSLIYIFAVRKFRRSIFTSHPFENRLLVASVVLGFVMLFIPFSIPMLRDLFKLTQLSTQEWVILFGLAFVQLIIIEIVKEIYNLKRLKKMSVV